MEIITVSTKRRNELIDITAEVTRLVQKQKIISGVCVVFCPHTTSGITINENADADVQKDIVSHLEQIVPEDKSYRHSEGNADSHIKSSLLGSSLTIIIEDGQLVLGTWQGIYLCECDGPRNRKVYIKFIKG